MSDQKLTTAEILAQIRGGGAPQAPDASADSAADAPAAAEASPSDSPEAPTAAPKAAAAPSGTADILAAIKGGGAGGGAAKPAAAAPAPSGTASILDSIRGGGAASKPVAAGKTAASPAAKSPTVDTSKAAGMSAAEMIKAARQGIVTTDPVTGEEKPEARKPVPLPKKPLKKPSTPFAPPKSGSSKKKGEPDRRDALAFLLGIICSPIVWGWTSLVAATAASSLAMARFMMPNVLVEPPTKFKIGPPTDFGAGTVSTKFKAQNGVWIVNDEIDGQQMIYALSTVCTHLGCTPNWLEGEQKFKCPCHGSGFYKTGINFEGPAPRPLERHGIRIAEDGMLEVDKSVKFQRELGQWEISASFVPV